MREIPIIYKNSYYIIHFRFKENDRFIHLFNSHIGNTDYTVFFDDARLKDQFGDPFEFSTTLHPVFQILLYKESTAWEMANAILKAIAVADSLPS